MICPLIIIYPCSFVRLSTWLPLPQGLKMRPIFPKITKIERDRSGPNLKIANFLNSNSKNKKNLEKLWKKLDQILRTLVEKIFQISTILLDKIQIELKM
jgi:hypothetical protein